VFQTSDSYCGRCPLDSLARRYDGIDRNSQRRLKALDALADLSTSRDFAATFRRALGELLDALRAETADLDDSGPVSAVVDADIEDSPVEIPLQYLHSDITRTDSIITHRDQGEPASALDAVHRELTRLRAFRDLRERVESGEERTLGLGHSLSPPTAPVVSASEWRDVRSGLPARHERTRRRRDRLRRHRAV
jgi:hypothetical protein